MECKRVSGTVARTVAFEVHGRPDSDGLVWAGVGHRRLVRRTRNDVELKRVRDSALGRRVFDSDGGGSGRGKIGGGKSRGQLRRTDKDSWARGTGEMDTGIRQEVAAVHGERGVARTGIDGGRIDPGDDRYRRVDQKILCRRGSAIGGGNRDRNGAGRSDERGRDVGVQLRAIEVGGRDRISVPVDRRGLVETGTGDSQNEPGAARCGAAWVERRNGWSRRRYGEVYRVRGAATVGHGDTKGAGGG